jgi:hypothetical protein
VGDGGAGAGVGVVGSVGTGSGCWQASPNVKSKTNIAVINRTTRVFIGNTSIYKKLVSSPYHIKAQRINLITYRTLTSILSLHCGQMMVLGRSLAEASKASLH